MDDDVDRSNFPDPMDQFADPKRAGNLPQHNGIAVRTDAGSGEKGPAAGRI
jgi:hypothetical protein